MSDFYSFAGAVPELDGEMAEIAQLWEDALRRYAADRSPENTETLCALLEDQAARFRELAEWPRDVEDEADA